MGTTCKKQNGIPQELQPFNVPELDTIPAFDNSVKAPKTGVAVPTEDSVIELKNFVEENKQ